MGIRTIVSKNNKVVLILLERFLRVISSVISFYFLSLFHDSGSFGYYAFLLAISYSFTLLSYFGLDQLLPKYYANKVFDLSSSISLKFLFSLLFSLLFFLLFRDYESVDQSFVVLISLSILFNFNSLFFSFYNNCEKISDLFFVSFTSFAFSLLAKVYAFYSGEVLVLYFSFFLEFLVGFVIFFIKTCSFSDFNVRKNLESICKFLSENYSSIILVFVSVLFIQINIRTDSLIISLFGTGVELSNYSLSLKLNEVFAVFISSLIASVLPRLYSSASSLEALMVVKKIVVNIFIITCFISVLSFLFVDYFVSIFFDEGYSSVGGILSILVFSTCFGGISSLFGAFLIYQKREKSRLFRVVAVTISNLLLCYILVHQYGVYGVAFAGAISSFIFGVFYNLYRNELNPELYR